MTTPPDPAQPASQPARAPRRGMRRGVLAALAGIIAILSGAMIVGFVVVVGYVAEAPQIPPADQLWSIRRSPGMTFLDKYGHVLATRGAHYGAPVKIAQLPPYVPRAFLAAEDRRFYQHGAVDPVAIARALATDLRAGRSAEGASTLTQQVARTIFLKRDRSLKRKVQEAWIAWRLEQSLSKNQVLELYLDRTYFGDAAYGLDGASETYFGKPASQLTLVEAATLAGLPNAPTRLALTNDLPAALDRAHRILHIMRDEGWISDAELAQALDTTPVLASRHHGEGDEGYVLDAAEAEAGQLAGDAAHDLVVTTTIDPALQAAGTDAVRQVVLKEGRGRHVSQGALVALGPDGAIVAMVGGLDHDASPFNRVTQARRQPGSAFKPFVYGAAVERGATAQEVRLDAPISYGRWSPENYGHQYLGPVTLQEALARSLNTVSVRLTLELGPSTVADFARRMGLSDIPEHPGPSIALGAYEVTPLELAAGYQVFQDGGGRTTPYLVSQIRSTRGDLIYSHSDSAPTPVLDPLYATRMVGMMKAVITSGTGTGANLGRPAAGKTGTSQDWRDAWFVGFTPDMLAAVWVGNDGGAPMAKVTGGELPTEIWKQFMTVALKDKPPRDFPWLVTEPAVTPTPASPVTTVADDALPDDEQDQPTIDPGPPPPQSAAPPPAPREAQAAPDPTYARDDGYYGRAPYEEVPRPPPRWREPPPGPDDYDEPADEGPPPDWRPPRRAEPPPPPYDDEPADEGPRYRY